MSLTLSLTFELKNRYLSVLIRPNSAFKIIIKLIFFFQGNSGLVPEAYVELSNEPAPAAAAAAPAFSNDDWSNAFSNNQSSSFQPGNH